jgi:hypothetical protein
MATMGRFANPRKCCAWPKPIREAPSLTTKPAERPGQPPHQAIIPAYGVTQSFARHLSGEALSVETLQPLLPMRDTDRRLGVHCNAD